MIHHIILRKREVLFCAVADGIGGLDYGEECSGFCLSRLSDWFYNTAKDMILSREPLDSIELSLQHAIHDIQLRLAEFQRHHKIDTGTTFTGILCIRNDYILLHIGDSKALILTKKGIIKRLLSFFSKDRFRVSLLKPTFDNIDSKGRLTHCIGMSGEDRPFIFRGKLQPNTLWLIGSDGILFSENYHFIKKSFHTLSSLTKESLQIKLEALGRNAVSLGSKDNMAVVGVLVK